MLDHPERGVFYPPHGVPLNTTLFLRKTPLCGLVATTAITYISLEEKMRKAFILYEHSLFASCLEQLLKRGEINVVGRAPTSKKAVDRIRELNPGVIFVETEKDKPQAEKLLSRLRREHPQMKLVCVNPDNNNVALYTGCRWRAITAKDLLKGLFPLSRKRD